MFGRFQAHRLTEECVTYLSVAEAASQARDC